MNNNRPIGIFDSGVGGVTVLKEICKYLPNESIIYFGDTKHLPYGSKSKATVTRLSTENVQFLLKKNVKFVVVACNTASALSLKLLKKFYLVPMLGVVESGAKAAAEATKNNKIGIIGTKATIESRAYIDALLKHNNRLKVTGKACPLFVSLVEEGWFNSKITELTAREYLKAFNKKNIDTLVLGCTHYPFLKPVLARVLKGVKLIDSATETAKSVKEALTVKGMLRKTTKRPVYSFYVTDAPEKFRKLGSSFLGKNINNVKLVKVE
ncbi:MAG: glutamate racemase [Candidatus Firestonebacteria bacterium RIFOXYC2_FULL_39_67]|nr:MAG: glutamate racemase [Candidatus Firestonebacteria bacterium RIFOXYD2_FULL_39_29]OGF53893.1 MAG: glutamate racemase [Candidatus Firestonebacteria bacterium RIFOXYC2_FULL_39_67]